MPALTENVVRITVLFFATLRTRAGIKSLELELSAESTVADLKARLVADIPNLEASLPSTLVSINRVFSFDEEIIPDGAEVAIFPPVSGG